MKLVQLTDIDTLMCWLREVIREVFGVDSDETLDAASRNYYIRNVGSGGHFAIVAKVGEQDAGCGVGIAVARQSVGTVRLSDEYLRAGTFSRQGSRTCCRGPVA